MTSIHIHTLCHDFVAPVMKRWSLFYYPKLVCDLLWPTEWSRNDRVPLLGLGLERPLVLLLFFGILQLFKLCWMMHDMIRLLACLIQELTCSEANLDQQSLANSLADLRCMSESSQGQLNLVHISTGSHLIWDLWAMINTYVFESMNDLKRWFVVEQ